MLLWVSLEALKHGEANYEVQVRESNLFPSYNSITVLFTTDLESGRSKVHYAV